MMKYSSVILLFAAAVFWSSATARSLDHSVQKDVIDALTRSMIEKMEELQLPEPHKTRLVNKLHEAQRQDWNTVQEYGVHVRSMMIQLVKESGIEVSRRKSPVDSSSYESFENEFLKSEEFYRIYIHMLNHLTPPAHKSTLKQMYEEALESNNEGFVDLREKADKMFEKVTGQDLGKISDVLEEDTEKAAEIITEMASGFIKLLLNE